MPGPMRNRHSISHSKLCRVKDEVPWSNKAERLSYIISLFLTLFGVILNLTIATLPRPILHCCLASLINPSFIEEPELSGASRSGTSPPSTCSLAVKPVQKGRHLEVGRSDEIFGVRFRPFSIFS